MEKPVRDCPSQESPTPEGGEQGTLLPAQRVCHAARLPHPEWKSIAQEICCRTSVAVLSRRALQGPATSISREAAAAQILKSIYRSVAIIRQVKMVSRVRDEVSEKLDGSPVSSQAEAWKAQRIQNSMSLTLHFGLDLSL